MDKDFEKYKVYKESIRRYLLNEEEIEIVETELDKLVSSLMEENGMAFVGEELVFVLGNTYVENKRSINKSIQSLPSEIRHIIEVDSIAEKIKLNIPHKKRVKYIYAHNSDNMKHYISIDSRLNSLILKSDEKKGLYTEGQVFVAKLYDLVKLYNDVGDSLFEKNVRYSLEKDKNSVEEAIHETLLKEPENFWFYSNGITLLADKIDCCDSKMIQILASDENQFSIINGAQTITACADFFYDPTINPQKIDDAKNAYVLLRIIVVHKTENALLIDKRNFENKISISLNRQKPIDSEDLAFNSDLVYKINDLDIDSSVKFKICKKGEINLDKKDSYYLSNVARYIMASKLQKPGAALNAYKATVLRMKGESFVQGDVFPQLDDENIEESFIENYGLVKISDILYNSIKDYNLFTGLSNKAQYELRYLIKNGEYYYVAIITRALFLEKDSMKITLEKVRAIYNSIDDNKLTKMIQTYIKFVYDVFHGKTIDYSNLKSDDLYREMYNSEYYMDFKNKICELFNF